MAAEVIDSNELTIATAYPQGWSHPDIPLRDASLVKKVFDWVREFREDTTRLLVVDFPEQTIMKEYRSPRNLPKHEYYGRQVIQHKFDTGAICPVQLEYWNNGDEKVAVVPEQVVDLLHDLGDRSKVAAAFEADAPIVNACDSDWAQPNEQQALQMLGIELIQILTDVERRQCTGRINP